MSESTKPTSNEAENGNKSKPLLALGRLTYKKLIVWLNNKFQRVRNKNYVVTEIARTYYSQNDYGVVLVD